MNFKSGTINYSKKAFSDNIIINNLRNECPYQSETYLLKKRKLINLINIYNFILSQTTQKIPFSNLNQSWMLRKKLKFIPGGPWDTIFFVSLLFLLVTIIHKWVFIFFCFYSFFLSCPTYVCLSSLLTQIPQAFKTLK